MKKGIEYSLEPDGHGKFTLRLVLGQLPSEADGKLVGAAIARTLGSFGVSQLRDALAAEDPEAVKMTPYELLRVVAAAGSELEFEETVNVLSGYMAKIIAELGGDYAERCRMLAIGRLFEGAPTSKP